MKHKNHSHTIIHHLDDGSHTMHRHHKDGSIHSSGHQTLDHLHDAIQDHLGEPNPGEAAADAGQHGVAAAQAAPAGLPMGAPPIAAPGA